MKTLSLAASLLTILLTGQAQAAGTVNCQAYPGQLSFYVSVDRQSASVGQQRYALQDGPASDLARTLHILPAEHKGPGVQSMSARAVKGASGQLDFSLTDGTVKSVTIMNLQIELKSDIGQDGKSNEILILRSDSGELLEIFSPSANCSGIFQ